MINASLAKELAPKLVLLVGHVKIEDLLTIQYKWGQRDGLYHSYGHMVKSRNIKMSKKQLSDLEQYTAHEIENQLENLFRCPKCAQDIRKAGLHYSGVCLQSSNIFIDSSGHTTRSVDENISHTPEYPNAYSCLACNYQFQKSTLLYRVILENNLNTASVAKYLVQNNPKIQQDMDRFLNRDASKICFKSIDEIPISSATETLAEFQSFSNSF